MLNRDNPHIGRMMCPYLGQKDDPSTSLAFPSAWNYCHKVKPPEPVSLEHQGAYCLLLEHVGCAVFNQSEALHLPRELNGSKGPGQLRISVAVRVLAGSAALLLLILLASRFGQMGKILPNIPSRMAPEARPTYASPMAAPSLMPVAQLPLFFSGSTLTPVGADSNAATSPLPTLAVVEAMPTFTATPTAPVCGTALESPVKGEVQFFIHKIQGGESLNTFADRYQTSLAAIQAVNYQMPVPLRENWVIAIPMSFSKVDGLPSFAVEQITQTDMTVDELANRLGTDPALLARFNGLDPDCQTFNGWFLVPRGTIITSAGP